MLKLAIIGCGRISTKHIQASYENRNKIHLVALCDIDLEKAERKLGEYNRFSKSDKKTNKEIKIYKSYIEMLEKQDIDIVSICTESGYHSEIAINCMRAGKHVIIEKPMALSVIGANEMILASKENHVKLCVSHQNRFNPSVQKLRQAVETGRFGSIIAGNARILWNRGYDYYSQASWRGTYELDGGCLMNQCIHNIDLLQWMMGGNVQWVNGEVENFIHPYIEAEDYGSIRIRFKNGAIGNVEGTICVYPSNLEETLTIIGEKGIASLGGIAVNEIETWRFDDNLDCEKDVMKEYNLKIESVYGNGHTPLYRDMIESIENDREPYISGYEGKKAMEIILAAYKSSKEGRRVLFPPGDIDSIDFKK